MCKEHESKLIGIMTDDKHYCVICETCVNAKKGVNNEE